MKRMRATIPSFPCRPRPCAGVALGLWLVCLLPVSGCRDTGSAKEEAGTYEIEKEVKRGPVAFTLKVSRKEMTIADRLELVLEVRSEETYRVKLPEFGDKLEQFGIVDYRSSPSRLLEGGVVLTRKSYILEPFLSGEYTIPPMTVKFWKEGDGKPDEHEMESEALTVTVKSLLPETSAELSIKEIVPPVELPRSTPWGLFAIAGAVLALAALAAGLIWRRKRSRSVEAGRLAPHEAAYQALERLLARRLLDKGEIKAFYLSLSDILRRYIEDRFALRAPERTTEEFLDDLRSADKLVSSHKDLLRNFLQHCDLVKFARHQPSNEEIQRTFDACKTFISQTEPAQGEPEVEGAAGRTSHAL